MANSRVCYERFFYILLRSWLAFLFGIITIGSFWYGCYAAVSHFAPGGAQFFKIALMIAVPIILLLLLFNEWLVCVSASAKRLKTKTDCPRLWQAVRRVSPWYAVGPMPRVYLLPDKGRNALSFGWGLPGFSAVGATQGLLDNLDDEELASVMAHEVGHAINKDILVSMTMTFSVMILALTGYLLMEIAPTSSSKSQDETGKSSSPFGAIICVVIGGLLYYAGRLVGLLLQAFVSRQREYAADAFSVAIIGSGQPLASALKKIAENPTIGSKKIGAALGFLCTDDPVPDDLLAFHPKLENRLAQLRFLEGE